jgi:acetyl-CoA C-acetyltransferase
MQSYGGAALILTTEEKAKQYTDSPIWITGFGVSTNSVNFEEMVRMTALKKAATSAYKMAGINEPVNDACVAEINNPFSMFEFAAYEALNLCEEGKAADLLREGTTDVDGKFPVNPSGGTLCTNAPNSNGLFRAIQSAMYLQSGKGNGTGKAIVHDSDMSIGLVGDSHAVMILEKEG